MIVYKIQNKINGKIYIGITTYSLEKRVKEHIWGRKNQISIIHKAISKYGIDNFMVTEIDYAKDKEELKEKEKYWISYYDSCNNKKGYNITNGGQGCRIKNDLRLSEDHKLKLRIAKINNPTSTQFKKGHKHLEDSLRKMRETKRINKDFYKKPVKSIYCFELNHIYYSISQCIQELGLNSKGLYKVLNGEINNYMGLSFKRI